MRIFVSYSSKDLAHAEEIVSDLRDMGHDVWYDQKLSGGQEWWDNILQNIRQSDVVLFIVSPYSLQSQPCRLEYSYADAVNRPIIPVRVADGVEIKLMPSELQKRQIVHYTVRDKEEFKKLDRAVRSLPPAPPLPDPLPASPPVPISYLAELKARIEAPELSDTEQLAILHEIKPYLNDPDERGDAVSLLRLLRAHRSLRASIAQEIAQLEPALAESGSTPRPQPPPPAQAAASPPPAGGYQTGGGGAASYAAPAGGFPPPSNFQGALSEVAGAFQQNKWQYTGGQSNFVDLRGYQQNWLLIGGAFLAAFLFGILGAVVGAAAYFFLAKEVRARLTLMENGNVWVASDFGSFEVSGGQQVMPFLMNNRVDNAQTRNAYLAGIVVVGIISSCCGYLLLLG